MLTESDGPMTARKFELPGELVADLNRFGSGAPVWTVADKERFRRLAIGFEVTYPETLSRLGIERENELWDSEEKFFTYLGEKSSDVRTSPGSIDPEATLIFASAEPDSPIALDYRTEPPRVLYFTEIDYVPRWIEIAASYGEFMRMVRGEVEAR